MCELITNAIAFWWEIGPLLLVAIVILWLSRSPTLTVLAFVLGQGDYSLGGVVLFVIACIALLVRSHRD